MAAFRKAFSFELKIPIKNFTTIPPKPVKKWLLNVYRNRPRKDKSPVTVITHSNETTVKKSFKERNLILHVKTTVNQPVDGNELRLTFPKMK